jgi:uncharacterized protein
MSRITHFDFSALDTKRAIGFYEKIFGWKFDKFGGDPSMEYYLVTTGPDDKQGINGGMGKREKDNYVVNSIEVTDIDKKIEDIKKNGGKILSPKMPIPGVGYWAMFEDTEQNQFSLMQSDPKAK